MAYIGHPIILLLLFLDPFLQLGKLIELHLLRILPLLLVKRTNKFTIDHSIACR